MTSKRSRQWSVGSESASDVGSAITRSDTQVHSRSESVATVNSAERIRLLPGRSGSCIMRKSSLKSRNCAGSWQSDPALASAASQNSDWLQSVPGMSDGVIESLIAASFAPAETNMSANESGGTDGKWAAASQSEKKEENAEAKKTYENRHAKIATLSTSSETCQATASALSLREFFSTPDKDSNVREGMTRSTSPTEAHPIFNNLDGGTQPRSSALNDPEQRVLQMASVIEKAVLDFCSSRTVETMRRMFADVQSDFETQRRRSVGIRSGENNFLVPHPVTGELMKEGIIIGTLDVFAPRTHREFSLEMKDTLVEGFLNDSHIFRAICHRTKCQLEITRRLLNKKLCAGGRWVKFLIVRIVGPSFRAIGICDQLLQKAVPAYKYRTDYSKTARCRMFFREDIPDNTSLYFNMQRTGGTSNRFGFLRLDTPYKVAATRTVGSCPWKVGALKVGKLSFSCSGAQKCMKHVYPSYGYQESTPLIPESQGFDAINRVARMHGEFLIRQQKRMQESRLMIIPVNR